MVKLLHVTDLHEDSRRVALAAAIGDVHKVDGFLIPGDFVGTDGSTKLGEGNTLDDILAKAIPVLQRVQQNFAISRTPGIEKITGTSSSPEEQKLVEQFQQHATEFYTSKEYAQIAQELTGITNKKYGELKSALMPLRAIAPIYGVMGNHDFRQGYDVLRDVVHFAERAKSVTIGDTKLVLAGDINTYESTFGEELGPWYAKNTLASPEGMPLSMTKGKRTAEVKQLQDKQRERLGDVKPDIFIAHKLPRFFIDKEGKMKTYGCNDVVESYVGKCKLMVGGHDHKPYITYHKETLICNPGTSHIFVYDMDAKGNVENILIYNATDKPAAAPQKLPVAPAASEVKKAA